MARVNIEDSLFRDVRFTELCIRLGSRTTALGAFAEACILAQEHYLTTDNDRLIPLIEWKRNPILQHVFDVGLAEARGKGIYVSGSDESFRWLIQRSDAGKKLKGSRSKRPKSVDKRLETKANGSKPLPLTPTLSLTLSSSSGVEISPPVVAPKELNALIWTSYSEAYQDRYGEIPVRNAKVNAQVAQLAKRLGSEAPAVAKFYVGHGKSYYVGKLHDLGLCLSDAEALRTQWATGHKVTHREAQQSDDRAAVNDQLTRIREGKL